MTKRKGETMRTDFSNLKQGEVLTNMDFSSALLAFKAGCVIVRDMNVERPNSHIEMDYSYYDRTPYFSVVVNCISKKWRARNKDMLATDWVIARDKHDLSEFFDNYSRSKFKVKKA